jgi:hypothetical protein
VSRRQRTVLSVIPAINLEITVRTERSGPYSRKITNRVQIATYSAASFGNTAHFENAEGFEVNTIWLGLSLIELSFFPDHASKFPC